MARNIYAHTNTTSPYPGYVSLNDEGDGNYSLTVRSNGNPAARVMVLDPDQLAAMALAINNAVCVTKPTPVVDAVSPPTGVPSKVVKSDKQ